MTSLRGATGLVTGASRGIGRAVAEALSDAGVRLVLASRGGPRLTEAARACDAGSVEADLSRDDGLRRLTEAVRSAFGGAPDVLVNAAGVFGLARVPGTAPGDLDRHLRVNLRAPFLLARAFLPAMLARGSGHLVHIGSVAGRRAFPENGAYSASKYGLRGFHEVLRLELAGTGVRCSLVEPGAVDTESWDPLEERLGEDLPSRAEMLRPEAVAAAVLAALRLGATGADSDVLLLPG